MKRTRRTIKRRRRQRGKGLDIQKWLGKTGIEFHWPGYQFMGPGTHLKKRLARGDPSINRLDRIAKQHDIEYARAKNLQDKWKADTKMIESINKLPGKKTMTERIVRKIGPQCVLVVLCLVVFHSVGVLFAYERDVKILQYRAITHLAMTT